MTTDYSRRFFLGSFAAAALVRPRSAAGVPLQAAGEGTGGARGKTQKVDSEIREYRDKDTGARVMQLTGDGSDNVHLYFTSESFVGGSDRLVFGSNRSGRFQLYLLEVKDRRLVQLTDGAQIEPQKATTNNGRLFYFDGPRLRCLRLDTMDDRELYCTPNGFRPYLPSCTADGGYVAFAYGEDLAVSTETGRIYATMPETYYQRRPCVIMRVAESGGKVDAAWGEHAWISHVIIHPTQPDLILFCHEGGSLSLQRMWTVKMTERGRKAEPLYVQKPNEYCVHEYFTRGGEIGYQYEVDRDGTREHYNCFIRPDGTWIRQYLLPGRRPGHIQSNTANSLAVGDAGYLSPTDKDGGNFMSLMTHSNGRAIVRRLCRYQPGTTQHSHGHPVFSLDDRWVLFNSQVGQRDNIYMADVESL